MASTDAKPIWHGEWTLDQLAELMHNTMADQLGIAFIAINHDNLQARLPVREQTAQRHGYLHGGA